MEMFVREENWILGPEGSGGGWLWVCVYQMEERVAPGSLEQEGPLGIQKSTMLGWMKTDTQTIISMNRLIITPNNRIDVTYDERYTWTLRIRKVKESDKGCYMCQINTPIMMTNQGCIDVQIPPEIVANSTRGELRVVEGADVILRCGVTGHPQPRIRWKREDGRLMRVTRGGTEIMVRGVEGSVVRLERVSREDMGFYRCIASNNVPPAVTQRVQLEVLFAPEVELKVDLVGAVVGSDVYMDCIVQSYPPAVTYWLRNETDVLVLHSEKYEVASNVDGFKTRSKLSLWNFEPDDIGTYSCVGSNSLGKNQSSLRLYEVKLSQGEVPFQMDYFANQRVVVFQGKSGNTTTFVNMSGDDVIAQSSFPISSDGSSGGVAFSWQPEVVLLLLLIVLLIPSTPDPFETTPQAVCHIYF
ncbi:unnamed protein product [Cyprideis torosa]|uniref:Uncharacterized protein n=1 Tax=Cyprideis torosa TaxID=163714 RepID=A0A7R8WF23_9CRUS|nr:unnamed protein product [Cyprideis torosa]CAG0890420.1 unnamed protein product [Cyprideis torosa]